MSDRTFKFLIFLPVILVYGIGMNIDVMDVDASQYASMAREMDETGSYLKLYNRGEDYLDKPPLLFWASAASFKIFGISNFSYKLPSVLFTFLGLFSTYRLGRALYNENVGFLAALVLASCQAWFLINHDVRTDTILAASTIFGVWQLVEFTKNGKLVHIFFGALGVAGAMLTKGPIGLMVPALAIGSDILVKRDWKMIFKWQWLLMLLLVGIFLTPFLIGLYQQYDLEPGKEINGMIIQSGIRFFLWTQSFGRLTGENAWRDDSTVLFFTHTFLWSFLPWSIFFLIAFWKQLTHLFNSRFRLPCEHEAITLGGFVLPFIAFSLSKYKLPHYIYVVFPMAAVMTGAYLDQLFNQENKTTRLLRNINFGISLALIALGILLCTVSFPMHSLALWVLILLISFLLIYYFLKGRTGFERNLLPAALAIIGVNLLLNAHVYPSLLEYQSYKKAALDVVSMNRAGELATFKDNMHSMDFYSGTIVPGYNNIEEIQTMYSNSKQLLFTDETGFEELSASGIKLRVLKTYDHFHVTQLTLPFLNPRTRASELRRKYLLEMN